MSATLVLYYRRMTTHLAFSVGAGNQIQAPMLMLQIIDTLHLLMLSLFFITIQITKVYSLHMSKRKSDIIFGLSDRPNISWLVDTHWLLSDWLRSDLTVFPCWLQSPGLKWVVVLHPPLWLFYCCYYYYYYLCVWVCAISTEARRGHWVHWSWSYGWLGTIQHGCFWKRSVCS